MKNKLVPMFFIFCIVLAGGILYASAHHQYKKGPQYTEDSIKEPLSLDIVRKSNITIEPNVEYSIVYVVRTYRFSEGFLIKKTLDTASCYIVAEQTAYQGPKPNLPSRFEWRR